MPRPFASGQVGPLPLGGSFCMMAVTVIVTAPPLGSVTPAMVTAMKRWFGGQSMSGTAKASVQSGAPSAGMEVVVLLELVVLVLVELVVAVDEVVVDDVVEEVCAVVDVVDVVVVVDEVVDGLVLVDDVAVEEVVDDDVVDEVVVVDVDVVVEVVDELVVTDDVVVEDVVDELVLVDVDVVVEVVEELVEDDVLLVVVGLVMVNVPATPTIVIVRGPLCASMLAGVNTKLPLAPGFKGPTSMSSISP